MQHYFKLSSKEFPVESPSVNRRQAIQASLALLSSSALPPASNINLSALPSPQLHDIRTLVTGFGVHAVTDVRLHETLKFELWDGRQWTDTGCRFYWCRVGDRFVCKLWRSELVPLPSTDTFRNCWVEEPQETLWSGGFLALPDIESPVAPSSIFMASLKTIVRCVVFSSKERPCPSPAS